MSGYSEILIDLGRQAFSGQAWKHAYGIASASPLDRESLRAFDDSLWGPSMSRIVGHDPFAPATLGIPGHGKTACHVTDRDIFRPLHYCAVDFADGELGWKTRRIVEMSSAHLEHLVKRIGGLSFLPMGNLLKDALVRRKLDPITWNELWRYREIYNAAKHEFDQELGTHLFSVQDAVLAYLIARRLAQKLYPLANLTTDWRFPEGELTANAGKHG